MSIKQSVALVCIVISALFIAQDMLEKRLVSPVPVPSLCTRQGEVHVHPEKIGLEPVDNF